MPKRTDLKSILVLGSGPIVIGQACEFDYSGTQACRALREQGYRVVLVNSNPATIMTDPEFADATYIEPLDRDTVAAIIAREKPDALLPTVGGQTALNLAVALDEAGVLAKHGVETLGASVRSVKLGEDRLLFKKAMEEAGVAVLGPGSPEASTKRTPSPRPFGFPVVIRPSFTLGGTGGGIAFNVDDFEAIVKRGLSLSPVHEVLVEESVLGWKEFELEVMRDVADTFVVVCSIENLDPMGVHTGDSITIAPQMTLSDVEYQAMRDDARKVIRAVGVATGGSNIQFAVDPKTGRRIVIEMNPRVSRSSALASKATGFPIAKIAALLAVGYRLDEIPNDITKKTPASFEPTLDYVVVKMPALHLREVPRRLHDARRPDEVGRRGDGPRAHLRRVVRQGAPLARDRPDRLGGRPGPCRTRRRSPTPCASRAPSGSSPSSPPCAPGRRRGGRPEITGIDPWFLDRFSEVIAVETRGPREAGRGPRRRRTSSGAPSSTVSPTRISRS